MIDGNTRLMSSAPPDTSEPDLATMTKAQLLDYAAETGVAGVSSSMTKARIIEAIQG